MFPNSNDNCLLGGVLVMRNFDWKNWFDYFFLTFTIVAVLATVISIIFLIVVSKEIRIAIAIIGIAVLFSGTIAYFLVKHNEKS